MSEQHAIGEMIISDDNCRNCRNIIPADEFNPNYQGLIATYGNDAFCTLDCFSAAARATAKN